MLGRISTAAHKSYVEIPGISAKEWERETNWFASSLLLTANQKHKILRELIGKDILMVEEDADIFMEYFRNQKNFLKFIGY